jgi:DNA-binding SARP family transcriptional activator
VSEDGGVQAGSDVVSLELLGHFRVAVGERLIGEADWPSRRAGELVALVVLGGGRMARDEVVDQLWPRLDAEAGAANLRKAAHYARRALGDADTVVLRGGAVELFPGRRLSVDIDRFVAAAERALREGDADACARVAAGCAGELLPDCRYESWTQEPRRRLHAQRCELLRRAGRWEQLLELEPTDEPACRELMRAALAAGRRHAAVRAYEHLRVALARELGVRPEAATRALYDECCAAIRPADPVFVGRELELAEATAHLRSVTEGRSAALLVRGPSGIGKTAFCRELARRAQEDGWRVVSVAAQTTGEPYGPIRAAVEQLVVEQRAPALPERTRSVLAALTPLAPAAPPLAGAPTRHQIIAALRRALRVDPAPAVLMVEDAHLLDEASADVLHQLVASGDALLMVLSYRAERIRTSLPRGVVALAHDERSLALALGPLEEAAISELVRLASPIPPTRAHVARIAELSGGNPFYALELARAPAAAALPQTVRQAILGRLAGLGAATLDATTRLAIGGRELDLARVLALTGLEDEAAYDMLDEALDAGVLVVAGARYRFRHELVRQVLTDELPGHRRLQLHREAARRLAAAGAAPESIADHWLRAEQPAEAVPWLLAATRRAVALGAFADALAEVERLLVEAPEHEDALCLRAEILDALGDVRAPKAYATAAAALGRPQADELRARQALAELKASNPDRALRTLAGARPRSLKGRLAEALTLSAAAAIGRYEDADTAAAKAQDAHGLALELGDPGAILDATWAHALAAHAKGLLPARLREYLHATHELPELATRVFDGQLCVTERMLYGGLPNEEIIAFAAELAREAERIGAARGRAFALTLRGEAELLAGLLDDADHDFAAGARLHGRIGAVAGEALSLLGRAQVAVRRSRHLQAMPFLAQALTMARESEVGHHTLDRVYGAMVEAAVEAESALRLVREAEAAIQGPAETCPTCRIAFIVPATIASARAGDLERAERYASDCDRALQIVALPPAWTAAVDEAHGWLNRAGGREEAARERFRRAAEGFRAWGQPLDAARCEIAGA